MRYILEEDWYGKEGCCLTCLKPEKREGCLCFQCKCRKCNWYIYWEGKGYCYYPKFKREIIWWEGLKIIRKTSLAIQIEDGVTDKKVWLPLSQISLNPPFKTKKGEFLIGIPRWLIEESGLDDEGWSELNGLTFKEYEEG